MSQEHYYINYLSAIQPGGAVPVASKYNVNDRMTR